MNHDIRRRSTFTWIKCFNCQKSGHLVKNCPMKKFNRYKRCFNCEGYGHYAKECKSPKTQDWLVTSTVEPEPHFDKNLNRSTTYSKPIQKYQPINIKKCHNCKAIGHFMKNCPKAINIKANKQKRYKNTTYYIPKNTKQEQF